MIMINIDMIIIDTKRYLEAKFKSADDIHLYNGGITATLSLRSISMLLLQ